MFKPILVFQRREEPMPIITRRASMTGLLGLSAAAALTRSTRAASAPTQAIPPEGIGRRINHISYPDQGGRPLAGQIMLTIRTIYLGPQFHTGRTNLYSRYSR